MEISIRVAVMEDVPALKALIPVSARELSKNYYSPEQIESAIKYIFGVDTQLISDKTNYIAEVEGDLSRRVEPACPRQGVETLSKRQIVGCGGWSKRKTMFGGDQMKAEADPLLDPKEDAGASGPFYPPGMGAQGDWPAHYPGL